MISNLTKKNTIIKTAVGYTRVSTEEQVDGASREVQKQAIADYCKANDIELLDVYWDGGFSAKNARRPELQRMLEDISSGKVQTDAVIVYNLSRLTRNLSSFSADIAPILTKKKVELRSTKETIDNTPQGKMMANLSICYHQFDNDTKSATTTDNMREIAAQGYWQSQAPLGFVRKHIPIDKKTKDGKTRYRTILTPDEQGDTAKKVEDVLGYFLVGNSVAETVRYAKKIGLKTRNGNDFSIQAMENLLSHPAMAGYNCSANLTDGKYIPAKWDGFISLDQHQSIVQRIVQCCKKTGEKQPYNRSNPAFPLKGTIYCEKCGYAARGSAPKGGSGKPSPRYHCSECSGAGSIMPEAMHDKFIDLIQEITPVKNLLKAFSVALTRAMKHSVEKAEKDVTEKMEQLEKLQEQDNESFKAVMRGERSQADHERYMALLEQERQQLQDEIAAAQEQKTLSEKKIIRLISLMENPADIWKGASLEVRQLLQQMIFPHGIKVNLGTGEFEKVGTHNLSPLYSVIPPKNDSNEPSLSPLVPGTGLEPARLAAYAPKAYVYTNFTIRA